MTRILLIDDEPDIRTVAGIAFETVAGWDFESADGAAEGVARALAAPPDAILVDVMMPEVDGFGTARLLKAEPALAKIPLIFLTARTLSDSEVWPAHGVIAKPFDPLTVASEVAELLGWNA